MIKNTIICIFLVVCSWSIQTSPDWTKVQALVKKYIGQGTFPGAVLKVANSNSILYSGAFGHFQHQKIPYGSPPMTQDSIFDIASLTKVSATLSAIMHLYNNQKLDVFDKVSKFIPQYANNGKQETLIQNLLLHNAGLLPDYPYLQNKPSKSEVMNWTYSCKLQSPIGTKFVYSDLSFILLGQIAQRIEKKPLQEITKNFMNEMGMYNSTYLPYQDILYKIVPTQYSITRKTLIRGNVHDPTAYYFGGVAGHAGLFSTASDLVKYMQIHLRKGVTIDGKRIYKEETVEKFYTRVDGLPYQNRRALGWDTVPIQTNPPCGTLFSLNSFGHTGYTGTMMWADRDKDLIIVFLTNRVHPFDGHSSTNLQARRYISDQIVKTLGLNKP